MSSKSIGEVAPYRPLTRCGPEELAIQARINKPGGGLLFARKVWRGFKDEAREHIIELLQDREAYPELHMLTMPGVSWTFEKKLLGRRHGDWYKSSATPGSKFTSIENDRFVYHGAITKFPGIKCRKPPVIQVKPGTPFAERVIGNEFIENFYFGNVDDLMRAATPDQYDAAWLDYTGPMSIERARVIKQFFETSVKRVLALTVLKARWNRETSDSITRAGGHTAWVVKRLPFKLVRDPYEYQDSESPMVQYIFTKE